MAYRHERSGGAHVDRSAERAREERRSRAAAEQAAAARHSRPAAERGGEERRMRSSAEQAREEKRARLAAEQRRANAERSRQQEAREIERQRRAYYARKKRRKFLKRLKITLIVLAVLALLALGGLVYMAVSVSESQTNFPNVRLNGIDVSGLTQAETLEKLNAAGWDADAAEPMVVSLPMGVSFELDRRTAGVALTAETAAAAAYRFGHTQDAYQNLLHYIGGLMGTQTDVALEYPRLDEAYIRQETAKAVQEFDALVDGSGKAETDLEQRVIRCVKGAGELSLNGDAIAAGVSNALLDGQRSFRYEQIDGTPTMPDFDALYTELNVEPVDAYFTDDGSFTVVDEVVGCSFDVSAARQAWEQAGLMEEVKIPLVITEPEVTGDALRSLLFRDLLGYQTTVFASSGENRINNIKLAASRIDGTVLLPGDVFSYNTTIGQRTKEAGFLEAGAYADGEVVQEVGGGICQVSSTLYCATLFANLETVSRTNHYFRVDYLPIAYDATVSWPSPDFQFRNNREYPIKIVAYTVDDSDLTVEIYGTDVDGSYVELTNSTYVVYDDNYTGVQIGWGALATRHIYNAEGVEIATQNEPYGIYHKHAEDIEWPSEYYAAQDGDASIIYG